MAEDLKKKPIKKVAKLPLENWDGMVEKADGSIGKWGSEIKPQRYKAATVRLYPQGEVEKSKVDSISRLPGVKKLLGAPTQRPGETAQYGTAASDVIKQLTKRK